MRYEDCTPLRELRDQSDLSRKTVAKWLGISPTQLRDIERGQARLRPGTESALRLFYFYVIQARAKRAAELASEGAAPADADATPKKKNLQ